MSLRRIMDRMHRQCQAADRHGAAEGIDVSPRAVLEGADRSLHPWMHGRRPADLADRLRRWRGDR